MSESVLSRYPLALNVYDHLYTLYTSDDHTKLRNCLDALPEDFRNTICYNIDDLAEKPTEFNDGAVHVFDSLPRLQETVQRLAKEVFKTISQEEAKGIAEKVRVHSGSPQTDDLQWGVHHAKDNVSVLLKSLSDCLGDLTPRHESILQDWHQNQEGGRQDNAVNVFRSFLKQGGTLTASCAFARTPYSQSTITLCDGTLSSLPPIFNEKPFPERLLYLDIQCSSLRALPREIGQLSHLEELNLKNAGLISIPAEISGIPRLRELILRGNRRLQGFPSEVLNLWGGCRIELLDTGLSQNILNRLRQVAAAEGYQGPELSLPNHDQRRRSFADLVRELSSAAREEPREYPHLVDEGNVAEWISRLSYTADYRRQGKHQVGFAKSIIGYLKEAEEDPEFRKIFLPCIADASTTCGDRVSLSVLNIGIAKRLKMLQGQGLEPLAEFLTKTVWPIELLATIAREKSKVLRFFDEIEVYLGYPIKLKERLGLEIDVQDMLYFECSALTDEDLESAALSVEEKQKNNEEKYAFLAQSDDWTKALEAAYPDRFAQIGNQADEELDAGVDPLVVQDHRLQALQALTVCGLLPKCDKLVRHTNASRFHPYRCSDGKLL